MLNSHEMIKILNQTGRDFPGERLCDGYYTKISDVYVWRSIFNRESCRFVKKLL